MFQKNLRRFFYKALKQPLYALGVAERRLKAYLYYRFSDGKASRPEAITLFLTHRCNLQCKMCGQWGEGGITKKKPGQFIKEELSSKELEAFVDDAAGFKPNITLFGGEPLLYSGLLEIIRYIKKKGMHCLVITNGFLLEEMAEGLVASSLDELNVSLDGGAKLHDEIRGMPGLFDKIMAGLKKVYQVKEKAHKNRPLVNLQCTITKYNYEHLEEMIDAAKEASADSLTFHNLIFTNQAILDKQKEFDGELNCSSEDWQGFNFEPGIDPVLLYAKMRKILSGKYGFSVDFYPNFSQKELVDYYKDPSFSPREYPARCLSPWIAAYVFPDGELKPCLNCGYSFGNIKDGKFAGIWNGEKAVRYRRALKKARMFPACVRCTELYRY